MPLSHSYQAACGSRINRVRIRVMLTVEIGVGLVSGGVFFLVLGLIMFFDATLLAMGNVLFVSGISLLIGPQKTLLFFTRKQKIRGTVCFFTGMALVFLRWALIGMVVEMIGFLNLFGCVLRVLTSSETFSLSSSVFCDKYLLLDVSCLYLESVKYVRFLH